MADEVTEGPRFSSTGSALAFTFRKKGIEAVAAELTEIADSGEFFSEYLDMVAAELRLARLGKVADLVETTAAQCKSGLDPCFSGYLQEPYISNPRNNEYNIAAWGRNRERFMRSLRQKRDEYLGLAGIDPEAR